MKLVRLVAVLFVLLTGISVSAQPELIPVKVQVIPLLSFAPHFIAEAEGFFEEQGLDVELIRMESAALAVPGLISGELDVIGGSVNAGIINAVARDGSLRLVADKGSLPADGCSASAILARPELLRDGTLEDAEQVRTLIHNQANLTSYSSYLVDRFLTEQFELSIDDLSALEIENALLSESMGNGALDLTVISEPFVSQLITEGAGEIWVSANEVLPDFTYAYIAYGDRLLNTMTDVGERFMIAYLQGVRQYNEGATDRNLDILVGASGLDRAVLEGACFPQIRDDGALNTDGLMEFQAWALERDIIDEAVAIDDIYDPRFIDAANAVLGEEAE